jgi:hypothetical protein
MVKVVWRFIGDVHDQLVVCHSRSDGALKKTATENAARGPQMSAVVEGGWGLMCARAGTWLILC